MPAAISRGFYKALDDKLAAQYKLPSDKRCKPADGSDYLWIVARQAAELLPPLHHGRQPDAVDRSYFPDLTMQLGPNPALPAASGPWFEGLHEDFVRFQTHLTLLSYEHFFPGFTPCCPRCGSSSNVRRDGWCKYLKRYLALESFVGVILSAAYRCHSCAGAKNAGGNSSFNAHDPKVLASLTQQQPWIAAQLPFVHVPSVGLVSHSALALIRLLVFKCGAAGTRDVLEELKFRTFYRQQGHFVECCERFLPVTAVQPGVQSRQSAPLSQPKQPRQATMQQFLAPARQGQAVGDGAMAQAPTPAAGAGPVTAAAQGPQGPGLATQPPPQPVASGSAAQPSPWDQWRLCREQPRTSASAPFIGTFKDSRGFVPSSSDYYQQAYHHGAAAERDWQARKQRGVWDPEGIYSMDHTFKYSKCVRSANHQPAFRAIFSVMTGSTHKIAATRKTHSTSLQEVRSVLEDVAARGNAVELVYVDNVASMKSAVEQFMASRLPAQPGQQQQEQVAGASATQAGTTVPDLAEDPQAAGQQQQQRAANHQQQQQPQQEPPPPPQQAAEQQQPAQPTDQAQPLPTRQQEQPQRQQQQGARRKPLTRQDGFHLQQRYLTSLAPCHCLTRDFMRDLSTAIYTFSEEDKTAEWQRLRGQGHTEDQLKEKPDAFWRRSPRVKVFIPQPQELTSRVQAVYDTYKEAHDAVTGVFLFTNETEAVHVQQMKLINDGLVSDPPGIPMYTWKERKKKYLCKRGSSGHEGMHRQFNRYRHGPNLSEQAFDDLHNDFVHVWNTRAGITNCDEVDYKTTDHRVLEGIKAACARRGWPDPYPGLQVVPSWQPGERAARELQLVPDDVADALLELEERAREEDEEADDDLLGAGMPEPDAMVAANEALHLEAMGLQELGLDTSELGNITPELLQRLGVRRVVGPAEPPPQQHQQLADRATAQEERAATTELLLLAHHASTGAQEMAAPTQHPAAAQLAATLHMAPATAVPHTRPGTALLPPATPSLPQLPLPPAIPRAAPVGLGVSPPLLSPGTLLLATTPLQLTSALARLPPQSHAPDGVGAAIGTDAAGVPTQPLPLDIPSGAPCSNASGVAGTIITVATDVPFAASGPSRGEAPGGAEQDIGTGSAGDLDLLYPTVEGLDGGAEREALPAGGIDAAAPAAGAAAADGATTAMAPANCAGAAATATPAVAVPSGGTATAASGHNRKRNLPEALGAGASGSGGAKKPREAPTCRLCLHIEGKRVLMAHGHVHVCRYYGMDATEVDQLLLEKSGGNVTLEKLKINLNRRTVAGGRGHKKG